MLLLAIVIIKNSRNKINIMRTHLRSKLIIITIIINWLIQIALSIE
jgi:hypothetical protein